MKRDIKQLSRLIVQLMDIQEGDREAKRRWEQRVRDAYPYGQIILTAKLGEIVDLTVRDRSSGADFSLCYGCYKAYVRHIKDGKAREPVAVVCEEGVSAR